MKATFTINQLQFELAAETAVELFAQVAKIQEVFEAETRCGACQSEEIRYGFRITPEGHKYYELQCRACGAQFKFGQKKQTNELFPKRKDDQGNPLPNGGWSKWMARDEHDAPPPRQQSNGVARPAGAGRPIPEYPDWEKAEKDPGMGRISMRVGGVLWIIDQKKGEYVEAPQHAQAK